MPIVSHRARVACQDGVLGPSACFDDLQRVGVILGYAMINSMHNPCLARWSLTFRQAAASMDCRPNVFERLPDVKKKAIEASPAIFQQKNGQARPSLLSQHARSGSLDCRPWRSRRVTYV